MTLHAACAVAGEYVEHSAALVHSLVSQPDVRVHYLHGADLGRRRRRALRRMGDVELHEVDPARLADLPVRGYFTSAMWYRMLLPELVDADRVLYLDVDTVVAGDLRELFATPMGDAWMAAVENVRLPWLPDRAADLGIERYFNSGVLLLDLAALRAEGAAERVLDYAREQGTELLWPDQDALNVVLGERRVELHPRWNAMNALFNSDAGAATFGQQAVDEALADPGIRHFEGPLANKPWHPGFAEPHGELYWRHLRATPFRPRRLSLLRP